MARVAAPSAANNPIRALKRVRCSVLVERAKASSSARSSIVNMIGVAEGLLVQP
jgi:hypothetical protein